MLLACLVPRPSSCRTCFCLKRWRVALFCPPRSPPVTSNGLIHKSFSSWEPALTSVWLPVLL